MSLRQVAARAKQLREGYTKESSRLVTFSDIAQVYAAIEVLAQEAERAAENAKTDSRLYLPNLNDGGR